MKLTNLRQIRRWHLELIAADAAVRRSHRVGAAEQQPVALRGDADVGGQELPARQRVHPAARHRPAQHRVGLRRRHLRRQGHETHAELGKDQVQEDSDCISNNNNEMSILAPVWSDY